MIDLGFEILFESDACLAVCKPPGLLTQAPLGIDSLEVRIKQYLGEGSGQTNSGQRNDVYLGVPHRLDRPASGAIVFGKTRGATRALSRQFERRTVTKVYWACLEGEVAPASGTWRDYLRKVPWEARSEVVEADHPDAQIAILNYQTLAAGPWGTWLQIELETGRTHQIRLQAASRGHPVLGDARYGSNVPFGPQYDDDRLRAIALHARELRFEHPKTREPIWLTAPVPETWRTLGIGDEG
jgi:23S rRNA pseudouridine1911/1915/1917 synthase